MSKLSKFAKEVMGYELTEYQTKLLEALGDGFAEGKQVVHTDFKGRAAGKTVAMRILGQYIQDGLNSSENELSSDGEDALRALHIKGKKPLNDMVEWIALDTFRMRKMEDTKDGLIITVKEFIIKELP